MNKRFHGFLIGISVLPALLVMPAMGYEVTEDVDLNDVFEDGTISEIVRSEVGYVGTLTTPNITLIGGEDDYDEDGAHLVRVSGDGSVLNFGAAESPVDSISIDYSKDFGQALVVWDDGLAGLYSSGNITVNSVRRGLVAWGTMGVTEGTLDVEGKNINVFATGDGIGQGVVGADGATVSIRGDNVNISGASDGVYAMGTGTVNLDVADTLTVTSSGGDGFSAWTKVWYDDDDNAHYYEDSGGKINIDTNNLTVNVAGTGIGANYMKSQISVNADGDVNIVAHGSDDTRAIHAGNATAVADKAKEDTSFISIKAKNINLTADDVGISAMSNGWIDLDGNVTIKARDAILARGYATVNINESGKNTVKMDGNVDFDYYSINSGSLINAYVNVNLTDAQSYWTGNTVASYLYENYPGNEKMEVDSFNLRLANGATWNATKIVDTSETYEKDNKTYSKGLYYIALNNLNIDKGTVNIADMDRGIIVENATIADATFNGGKLNIGEMTLTSGTSIFNNDVVGVDADSVLTVDSGATMNIGTNNVNVNTITLNGTMLATVRTGDDAQITAATKFDGNGELKLSFNNAGTYKVFGGKIFDNVDVSSSVYDLNWNEGTLVVTQKSVEDIASDNNLSTETATAISGLMTSTSETLNDLAVAIQEKLASGTDEERAEVEHAQAAIHPETESVVQSVSSSVQNTVTSLATGRMSMPIVGRNGGDVNMTSGGVWAQGIFNKSKQNDAFNGYTRGIAAGLDGTINKVWTIGAGYAFAHSDITGTARDTEIDSSSIFVYGQYKPSAWYMNLVANYTMADYTETGAALGTGISAKYDVDSFGANIATGYDFVGGITPELGLRYMHINSSDYINSLGVKNELADADYLTATLGTKYAFDIKATKRFTLRPELNYGVKYDMLSDKQVATVTMPGVNAYALNGERLSRIAGEFGIGLTMNYRELDVSLNYDIEAREDYTSQSGRVKFRYNF